MSCELLLRTAGDGIQRQASADGDSAAMILLARCGGSCDTKTASSRVLEGNPGQNENQSQAEQPANGSNDARQR